jgi:tRNA 2-thiouridine synthesizing protein A
MKKKNTKKRKEKIDQVLDVQGLLCPMPTVMTGKTLKEMQKGKSLQVITNDVTTKKTIPPLCDQEGCELLDLTEKEGLLYFTIRK